MFVLLYADSGNVVFLHIWPMSDWLFFLYVSIGSSFLCLPPHGDEDVVLDIHTIFVCVLPRATSPPPRVTQHPANARGFHA